MTANLFALSGMGPIVKLNGPFPTGLRPDSRESLVNALQAQLRIVQRLRHLFPEIAEYRNAIEQLQSSIACAVNSQYEKQILGGLRIRLQQEHAYREMALSIDNLSFSTWGLRAAITIACEFHNTNYRIPRYYAPDFGVNA
ncbi:MAG: hypothetical protein ACO3EZ_14070 [Prochlorotrichaceae cyanobacterium]